MATPLSIPNPHKDNRSTPRIQRGAPGEPGRDGLDGIDGIDGGGLAALVDDPSPQLGGDLALNGFKFEGSVETPDFVLDGGLLG